MYNAQRKEKFIYNVAVVLDIDDDGDSSSGGSVAFVIIIILPGSTSLFIIFQLIK